MKLNKIISCVVALCFMLTAINVFAYVGETNSFEISSDDFEKNLYSLDKDEVIEVTKIFSTSDPNIENKITVTITKDAKATDTVNFVAAGRYYFKSNDVTISNYGIKGSADYNGTSVFDYVYDVYHDVKPAYKSKYTGTARKSTSSVTDGREFKGKYKLKNTDTGNFADDAQITVLVKKDGYWKVSGNFDQHVIN